MTCSGTSVTQTIPALELRSLLPQLKTAVWELMRASHNYGNPGSCHQCISEHSYSFTWLVGKAPVFV